MDAAIIEKADTFGTHGLLYVRIRLTNGLALCCSGPMDLCRYMGVVYVHDLVGLPCLVQQDDYADGTPGWYALRHPLRDEPWHLWRTECDL